MNLLLVNERTGPQGVGVINYGAGNLGNVLRALASLQIPHRLLETPEDPAARTVGTLLLPGVGAFRPAMQKLSSTGWADFLNEWVEGGGSLVGICAGMQLLCTMSAEDGQAKGLGFLDAEVRRLDGLKKIPHMGWNTVTWKNIPDNPPATHDFYFVHSYAAATSPDCIGTTEVDGVTFCSALQRKNVVGFQFHPERSGAEGVAFLGGVLRSFGGYRPC